METKAGRVIWITGFSGSGKTTLAKLLQAELPNAILLDGDELREIMDASNCAYTSSERKNLAMKYAGFARLFALQGFNVIVATISLFHDVHFWNRANLPNYTEIFLDVSETARKARDKRGLYDKSPDKMVGGGVGAELPLNPHLRLTGDKTPSESANIVINYLKAQARLK